MNKKFTRYFFHITCLFLSALSWQACNVDLDAPTPYLGTLRLQRYVAIGDAYSAGFANGGLYAAAQQKAFPTLFAGQLRALGLDLAFRSPLLSNNGSGYYQLTGLRPRACNLLEPLAELAYYSPASNWSANVSGQGPYENMGIPGLSLRAVGTPASELQNMYLSRLAANDSATLPEVMDQQGDFDFFTLWLGTEEVMAYALSGGTAPLTSLLDPADFQTYYGQLLDHILATGTRKGVVANLPNVLTFPYFTHVPHTSINLPECVNVELAVYIVAENGEIRIATADDHILLPAANQVGLNGFGLSESLAVPDQWVLDVSETQLVKQYLDAYNRAITEVLAEKEAEYPHCLALLDLHKYFSIELIPGHVSEGINVSGKYLTGSVFSLDGYSFTPRGNALIANRFIGTTNNYFSTRIPTLNISDYPGVEFP